MGKKLDALLGRSFKTSKFKAMVNLAISRLAVLKNQHQARFSMARSDVIQILNLGHHERALLRVEQVMKEQSMLDVLVMIENYCYLLIERVNLLEHAKECPEELKEAISSMMYAATRCGEFPELRELRVVFTSRFGKEFVARAAELRNHCGVNPKMIQKLSTRMPSLESRVKVLKGIALENNIVLQVEEADSSATEGKMDSERKEDLPMENLSNVVKPNVPEDVGTIGGFSNSIQTRRKYKDVADAAQAAFESAAYAAEAARAAVELSRGDSQDSDDPRNPSLQSWEITGPPKQIESIPQTSKKEDSSDIEDLNIQNQNKYYSESEDEDMLIENKHIERSLSTSSLDSADNILNETKVAFDEERQTRLQGTDVAFNGSDDETTNISRMLLSGSHVRDTGKNYSQRDVAEDSKTKDNFSSEKELLVKSQAGDFEAHPTKEYIKKIEDHLSINKTPVSVRTRRTYRR